ncbi:lipoyl protein ligase domain-containing protein [Thiobacter aerophilum]|uniref:BPL/LPL catalytic domain-containing protein n=1 Tax=Thiobacter aerophilum TaxID=3121275 RepID=A0ABV0EFF6_9BURK
MAEIWRLLDTGLRGAAENIAFNRALLEARAAGEGPNTLRFLRFTPSALVGFHQDPRQELDLDYCQHNGIEVQRRITGGGAIYFDAGQLGWELYLHRSTLGVAQLGLIAQRICEAAAQGISALGVDARFRPRNDIEVGGRKISGTGGVFEGEALMYQGTLLIEFDVSRMLRVLRIPAEKLADKALTSARERVASLAELLGAAPALATVQTALAQAFGQAFQVGFAPAGLNEAEQRRFATALAEVREPAWVFGEGMRGGAVRLQAMRKFPAGLVRVGMAYDAARDRIEQIQFTGDFFVHPRRALLDLEAALRDVRASQLEAAVHAFFAAREVDLAGLRPADFVAVAQAALAGARTKDAS